MGGECCKSNVNLNELDLSKSPIKQSILMKKYKSDKLIEYKLTDQEVDSFIS